MSKKSKQNWKNFFSAIIIFILLLLFFMYLDGKNILKEDSSINIDNIKNDYKNIEPEILKNALRNKDDNKFFLINVDVSPKKSIEKTDLFIPFDKIISGKNALPKNKNTKIVVYSEKGNMSKIASSKLILLGYSEVFNLKGGLKLWENKNFNLEILK